MLELEEFKHPHWLGKFKLDQVSNCCSGSIIYVALYSCQYLDSNSIALEDQVLEHHSQISETPFRGHFLKKGYIQS